MEDFKVGDKVVVELGPNLKEPGVVSGVYAPDNVVIVKFSDGWHWTVKPNAEGKLVLGKRRQSA